MLILMKEWPCQQEWGQAESKSLGTSMSLIQTSTRRHGPDLRWAFPSLLCSISQQFLLLSAFVVVFVVVVVRCFVFPEESICDCPLIPSKLSINTFSKHFQNLWESDRVIGGILHSSYALYAGPSSEWGLTPTLVKDSTVTALLAFICAETIMLNCISNLTEKPKGQKQPWCFECEKKCHLLSTWVMY